MKSKYVNWGVTIRTNVDLGENTIEKWNKYEDLGRSMKIGEKNVWGWEET